MLWRNATSDPYLGLPLARLLLLVALALPAGACSSFPNLFVKDEGVAPDEPPEKLYNEGIFLSDKRQDYKDAAKKFEEVERQHPYSDWARKALLMTAYTKYEAKEYDESVSAARRYVTLVLALGEHDPDFVDAYYGPKELREEVKRAKSDLTQKLNGAGL